MLFFVRYGGMSLVNEWFDIALRVYGDDFNRLEMSDLTMCAMFATSCGHAMFRYASTSIRAQSKQVMSMCYGDTPADVDASFACAFEPFLLGGFHWSTAEYTFFGPETLKTTAKRRQYLLSPDAFEVATVLEWHPPVGSSTPGVQPEDEAYELAASFLTVAAEEGEATLECLGDAEGAIVAANISQARYPFAGINTAIPSLLVLGRVLAAVDRRDEAQEIFKRAQSESHHQRLFYYEALAVTAALECGLLVNNSSSIRKQLVDDPSEYAPGLA
jgi:hypothetical protein